VHGGLSQRPEGRFPSARLYYDGTPVVPARWAAFPDIGPEPTGQPGSQRNARWRLAGPAAGRIGTSAAITGDSSFRNPNPRLKIIGRLRPMISRRTPGVGDLLATLTGRIVPTLAPFSRAWSRPWPGGADTGLCRARLYRLISPRHSAARPQSPPHPPPPSGDHRLQADYGHRRDLYPRRRPHRFRP